MRTLLFISLFAYTTGTLSSYSQEKVTFWAEDSLKVTANLYLAEVKNPFIILFHQAGSSRGEYKTIAPRLMNLGYNCLAVDLRSGSKMNYVQNETALRAKKQNRSARLIDAKKDIEAAITYVKKYNKKPVILFGSSYSASLALVVGGKSKDIKAVVAFSPGEYFQPDMEVKARIERFEKPLFVSTTAMEYSYAKKMLEKIPSSVKTLYKPSKGQGVHGARALWEDSEGNKECWFQLTYFFSTLEEI